MKHDIQKLFIKESSTIKEAMKAITEAANFKLPVGIALISDGEGRLVGSVTDGDIRKALVDGSTAETDISNVMVRNPITVEEGLDIDEMLSVMTRKVKESGRIHDTKVDKIIVTNKENRVVDVVDFYELWYKQETRYKNVCVVGTGHVGLTLSLVLAELGYQTNGYDVNETIVNELKKGRIRFYEKGIEPLLKFHLKEKNIQFEAELKDSNADIYFISVGTPVDEETGEPIDTAVRAAATDVGKVLKKDDVVILRSTVAVGTTRNTALPILEKESGLVAGKDFYLAFAPERVVEGNALEEIRKLPQIVGGLNKKSVQEATRILQKINPSVVMLDSLEEAEMVKLINNTYRDYSFAFANKLALLCSHLGLDSVKLIKAASEGYPRNPVPLPSPGVGGYCLTKDPYLMANAARGSELDPEVFVRSRMINDKMPKFVAQKVIDFVEKHHLRDQSIKIFFMGFAFKGYPETSDMRNSPTIDVINHLKEKLKDKIEFFGYDAIVEQARVEALGVKFVPYKEGFEESHCALIMNNHPDFSKVDIFSLVDSMKRPGFLFDGWHFYSAQEIERVHGIIYQGLGGFR